MRPITHLVVHTAAAKDKKGKPVDQSVDVIRAYHKGKGWSDIGYHYLIRFNGSVEHGRPEALPGAGVAGFNAKTIHICCTGHGDVAPFTSLQNTSLLNLLCALLMKYNLADEFLTNPMRVLGHRECYALLAPQFNTRKTCPGTKVDMRKLRLDLIELVKDTLPKPAVPEDDD